MIVPSMVRTHTKKGRTTINSRSKRALGDFDVCPRTIEVLVFREDVSALAGGFFCAGQSQAYA
jgi:hypothetical protein